MHQLFKFDMHNIPKRSCQVKFYLHKCRHVLDFQSETDVMSDGKIIYNLIIILHVGQIDKQIDVNSD